MTDTRQTVLDIVRDTAPEIDIDDVDTSAHFLEELGLDSMDYLDLVTRVYEETGVNIPESDYEQVDSIDALVAYLEERE
ncbi:MAG: acyl carrier protein [Myxococcota bacterium]